ncbi:hypothetical protein EXM22_08230 [Oceanispirochaeta crateris]|uniref:GWxTD domain-containing protein n=2 Tax=Oceanispirochaeta crateris TaxID=2518645 RepID=A0A5C1QK49_9SPIO|nr:hypothetical protein EXM22_08230 [Oceanispirochaeta crateris]
MKKMKQLLYILLLCLLTGQISAQTAESELKKVYAPFPSRLSAKTKGTGILLTWKDAKNLNNPTYNIYESMSPIDPESFIYEKKIATLSQGIENYLYEPGDSIPRYFLILAEEDGILFDVFIPYRNMTMESVSAAVMDIQEEKATRISSLEVLPKAQSLLIKGRSSRPQRAVILFRSTEPMEKREDLSKATKIRVFLNETIELRDQVIPGIPFYYALVDKELYESGSSVLLYDGSVTPQGVTIPLEDLNPDISQIYHYTSRPAPLPLLNVELDIEKGNKLPDPGVPSIPVELSSETENSLASLNLGKAVHPAVWRQAQLLSVDRAEQGPTETSWVNNLMRHNDWESILTGTEEQLKITFDEEIKSRLFFYKGQANYFLGNLEYAFMDFLSSREVYYSESNAWISSIYEQRKKRDLSRNLD